MSNHSRNKTASGRPAAPSEKSVKDPSGRAEFDALRERASRLALKNPAKAATLLTEWLKRDSGAAPKPKKKAA